MSQAQTVQRVPLRMQRPSLQIRELLPYPEVNRNSIRISTLDERVNINAMQEVKLVDRQVVKSG